MATHTMLSLLLTLRHVWCILHHPVQFLYLGHQAMWSGVLREIFPAVKMLESGTSWPGFLYLVDVGYSLAFLRALQLLGINLVIP